MIHRRDQVMPSMRDWWDRTIARENEQRAAKAEKIRALPKTRTPCTELELRAIAAIAPGWVTYIPGIGTKRFARQIQGVTELTERQRIYLWQIVWRFRRQIADRELIREAKDVTDILTADHADDADES